ncbi:hypothetical protein AAHB54_12270 [Bacillus cereus]
MGQGPFSSPAVMMGLAYILSLCSEADAFIVSSFQSTFSTASLVAFNACMKRRTKTRKRFTINAEHVTWLVP